jgi:hypothetical protein
MRPARLALVVLCILASFLTAISAQTSAAEPGDVCENLAGIQPAPPDGYVQNGVNCDPLPDVCDNYDGIQSSAPEGTVVEGSSCVPIIEDQCSNIPGTQESVPSGMNQVGGECNAPPVIDRCSNIAGSQETVPKDLTQMADNRCVLVPSGEKRATTPPATQVPVSYTPPAGQPLPYTGSREVFSLGITGALLVLMGLVMHSPATTRRILKRLFPQTAKGTI